MNIALRTYGRLPMRPETASTKRGYAPLPGIATQFLHLHEAAPRRNVAYGEGRHAPPDDAADDSEAHNGGKLKEKRRSALRRLQIDEDIHNTKGQWSQMPIMEWPLRRLEETGAERPRFKLAALIYVKIQVQRYRFQWNGQNLRKLLTTVDTVF